MVPAGTYLDPATNSIRPLLNGIGLRLYGATSGYSGFKPATTAGSVVFTLPSADGTSGQVLTTNGSTVLSFSTPSVSLTGRQQYNLVW
jgi:hypothetical protein